MAPWALDSPERLAALEEVDVFPGVLDDAFEVYTRLIARLLDAPTALVSFVTPDSQFFPAFIGLGEPWSTRGGTPIEMSFCQHVVRTDDALIVTDARNDDRVKDNLAIDALDVQAYIGVPMHAPGGEPLGALCAIDSQPREWSDNDLAILRDVAEAVAATISLRVSEHRRAKLAAEASHQLRTPLARLRFELDDLALAIGDVEGAREGVEAAVGHVGDLADTVSDLLSLAQEGPLQRSSFDLLALAYAVAQRRIEGGISEPGSIMVEGASVEVHTSRGVLQHIVDRLLDAVRASESTVTVYVSRDGESAHLDISAPNAPADGPDLDVARRLLAVLPGRLVVQPSPAVDYQVVLPCSTA